MGDLRAFATAIANQVTEMRCLVVEATAGGWLVQFDSAAVDIMHSCVCRVPPVGVQKHVAARAAEKSISAAEQVEPGAKLGHSPFMLCLKEGKVVNAGRAQAAHALNP